jgi:hypothetical protein
MSIAAFRYVFFKVTATGYLHYALQCKAKKDSVADPDPGSGAFDPCIWDSE